MANEKTIKTRIQLKNDTEANWIKATGFTPKRGEVIIYSAELEGEDDLPPNREVYYPFPRLKIGDGNTNVNDLPFIDAGTINGVNINNIRPYQHKLIFGSEQNFVYDGSEEVIVPIYTGDYDIG